MKSECGIGVIGCGGRIRGILNRLLARDPRLRLVGLYDPVPRQIQRYLDKYQTAARVHRDYEELVQDPQIDWVLIGSWNCFHARQAIAALNAGKHVFCEKPLATTVADCLAIQDAWRKSGRHFSIGFTLRYSPHYRRIHELLSTGAIGSLISMEFNETLEFNHGGYIFGDWRRLQANAGPHLLEKCCHDIDLAGWMVNSVPAKVASFGGTNFFVPENAHHIQRLGKNQKGVEAYRASQHLPDARNPFTSDKDIFDNQVAIIEYANQVRATFHTNCNTGLPERRMYLCGTEGTLRADVMTGQIELRRIGFETRSEDRSTEAKGGHGGGDDILAESLLRTIFEDQPPLAGLEEGLKSALTCLALEQAARSGETVRLEPLWLQAGIPMNARTT